MESPIITALGFFSQRGEAVPDGDLKVGGQRKGRGPCPGSGPRLPLLVQSRSVVCQHRSEGDLDGIRPGCIVLAGSDSSTLHAYLRFVGNSARYF